MIFMSNVGIDLHKTCLTIAVRDNQGNLVNTNVFDTKCIHKITKFISELPLRRGGYTGHNKNANIARLKAKAAKAVALVA